MLLRPKKIKKGKKIRNLSGCTEKKLRNPGILFRKRRKGTYLIRNMEIGRGGPYLLFLLLLVSENYQKCRVFGIVERVWMLSELFFFLLSFSLWMNRCFDGDFCFQFEIGMGGSKSELGLWWDGVISIFQRFYCMQSEVFWYLKLLLSTFP